MRRRYWLVPAAAVAAGTFAHWTLSTLAANDPPRKGREITVITHPSALPVGARCTVELAVEPNDRNERVEIVYEGKIAKATDNGITLTVTSKREKATSRSGLSKVPIVNRLFTNVGIAQATPGQEKDVWIEAGKIRSVTLTGNSTLGTAHPDPGIIGNGGSGLH